MTKLIWLFIFRTEMKYQILFLIICGIIQIIFHKSQAGIIYCSITLIIKYIVFFKFLERQNDRLTFIYRPNELTYVKHDIGIAVLICEQLFLISAIVFDMYYFKEMFLIKYHVISVVSYILSINFVKINIEKKLTYKTRLISLKEAVYISILGLVIENILLFIFN